MIDINLLQEPNSTVSWSKIVTSVKPSKINEIHLDPIEEFDKIQTERQQELSNIIVDETKILDMEYIVDKPDNLNSEYIQEEIIRKLNSSKISKNVSDNINNISTNQEVIDISQQLNKTKCYTCNPRKQVKKHIIESKEGITFHHDMCGRNVIIVTPDHHFEQLDEYTVPEIGLLFSLISNFCKNWNINDYSVTYNQGNWQTHKHFHIKIKLEDKIAKRMRGDHFRLLKLKQNYETPDGLFETKVG